MLSRTGMLLAASLAAWTTAVALSSTPAEAVQKTTNDGLYTKAQADRAKPLFDKVCAACHAFTVAAKKKPADLPLGDTPFFDTWEDRPIGDLVTTITLTMPNDGSAVISDTEALDLVAYILQQNGFPAGPKPLTAESAAAVIALPKK